MNMSLYRRLQVRYWAYHCQIRRIYYRLTIKRVQKRLFASPRQVQQLRDVLRLLRRREHLFISVSASGYGGGVLVRKTDTHLPLGKEVGILICKWVESPSPDPGSALANRISYHLRQQRLAKMLKRAPGSS